MPPKGKSKKGNKPEWMSQELYDLSLNLPKLQVHVLVHCTCRFLLCMHREMPGHILAHPFMSPSCEAHNVCKSVRLICPYMCTKHMHEQVTTCMPHLEETQLLFPDSSAVLIELTIPCSIHSAPLSLLWHVCAP